MMLFYTKNKYFNHNEKSKEDPEIIKKLYFEILNAYKYLQVYKKKHIYDVKIKKITNVSQIPKPHNFNSKSFPDKIRNHIDQFSICEINYNFSLFNKNIKLFFLIEEEDYKIKINTYNKYVDAIIMWLCILNQHASKECAESLVVYLYFTSLEKQLPSTNIAILDETNVNTAFTTTCPKDSEIIIYRKEEWFKVFIHETFHNFGLDFSDMDNSQVNKCILNIFNVKSDVNLYESYTETWAEIMNALFCSFYELKNKNNLDEFILNSELLINLEKTHSFFQLVKTLNFMGLSYKDLYLKNNKSQILRETLYKEKTNVLSYYVIKTVLLNNYESFLLWCKNNNLPILQFKKTIINQNEYCKLIEKNYKKKNMLENINYTEKFINNLNRQKNDNYEKYLLTNLRMSVCELG